MQKKTLSMHEDITGFMKVMVSVLKQSSHQTDFVFASIATINQRGSVVAQNRTTFEGT